MKTGDSLRALCALLLAVPAVAAEAPPLVIRGASIFDSARGEMLPGRTVTVEGGRIRSVVAAGQRVRTPRGALVIDGRGKYLIPGLIDAHVHTTYVLDFAHITADQIFPFFLANGVTSIRSVGDLMVAQKLLSRYAAEHPDRSPRMYLASPLIDGASPIHGYWARSITDPEKIPAFVADMAEWGITTLKIYVGTERAVGRRVIDEGHKRGLVVTGHLGKYSAQDAVADGIDSLEHIWSVFNFILPPESADPGASVLARRANLDLDSQRARDLIEAIKARGVVVDPTLTVFRNMLLLADLAEVYQHPDNVLMPKPLKEYWLKDRAGRLKRTLTPETLDLRRREFQKYKDLTGILYRAGIPLLAGTDTPEPFCPPGFSLHQELELLVESGLPPAAALQAATINNARILRLEARLGSIEPGKLADMVILSADPLASIRNSRKIVKVIKDGKVYDPESLLRS